MKLRSAKVGIGIFGLLLLALAMIHFWTGFARSVHVSKSLAPGYGLGMDFEIDPITLILGAAGASLCVLSLLWRNR